MSLSYLRDDELKSLQSAISRQDYLCVSISVKFDECSRLFLCFSRRVLLYECLLPRRPRRPTGHERESCGTSLKAGNEHVQTLEYLDLLPYM